MESVSLDLHLLQFMADQLKDWASTLTDSSCRDIDDAAEEAAVAEEVREQIAGTVRWLQGLAHTLQASEDVAMSNQQGSVTMKHDKS